MSETPEEQRQERRMLRQEGARQRRRLASRLTGWVVLLVALAVVAWASVHS
ncbi:hypothetical protein ACFRAI_36865 [Streptomyces sp. NPDC056637]|uniref:hypothetical protein n=1 Tax=unclassified Streptomyces TaxID=2593676 RepID=UPI00363717DA